MKRIIHWFVHNGVAANLLMVLIIVGGILTVATIKMEIFPEFSSDLFVVSVVHPGAAPEEVENAVCVRIEEAIQGLEGIKRISSSAGEGVGSVVVETLAGADTRRLLDDLKTNVDAIDTFPEEAEKPIIQEIILRRQVIYVAVSGETDERTLKRLGERVRDDIAALPGITQVQLANARPYEISIEVAEGTLRRHGLTFDDVARAVRRASLDLPGGSVKTPGGEVLLRTRGQAYRGPEFEAIPLLTRPDGTRLLVGDVARVVDGFAETDQSARFDGKPTVLVQVFRTGNQNALDIAAAVKDYCRTAQARMPAGIVLTTWQDDSEYLRDRMSLLLRNARAGFILVFLILAFFLRFRLAFWVAIGIPISFLGALWFMPALEVSINMLSLFAFILVLGIVVDDAIVVGENIFTHGRRTRDAKVASVGGAQEVTVPVIFGVMTTVAAFSPLLFIGGNMGKFMRVIPIIVISTLLVSLIESMFVLPNHLSHSRTAADVRPPRGPARIWGWIHGGFNALLARFRDGFYRPLLEVTLRWRYFGVAAAVAVFALTLGYFQGGWIRYSFFPDVEGNNVGAFLTMPQGTPVEVTAAAVRRMEKAALQLQREIEAKVGPGAFLHMLASVGEQPYRTDQKRGGGRAVALIAGSHLGEINIQLSNAADRPGVSSAYVANRWRELTGTIPDAVELTFTGSLFSAGEAINVQLSGDDLDMLRRAADDLKAHLATYPGVFDITDSFRAGKEEVKLRIRPEAEALGLGLADLARQVRQAFYGEEAQRIQRGRDEVKVMVRYPAARRRSLGDLESMRIRTPDGAEVPFAAVAEAEYGRGYATISRVDRRRVVNVTADVDDERANAEEILRDLEGGFLKDLLERHSGLRYTYEGEQREQAETIGGLIRGFLIALIGIYALLAIPLRSYFQPLLIMFSIPFGLVGAVWGHVIMGMDLTILSLFGLVALAGVVVNDSLVLVDFVNRRRAEGLPLGEAVREGTLARFRAILLTSLTTFAGLTPLILETSLQARFLIPMAISLAFGVIFATVIALLILPCSYLILEDLKRIAARTRRGGGEPTAGEAGRE